MLENKTMELNRYNEEIQIKIQKTKEKKKLLMHQLSIAKPPKIKNNDSSMDAEFMDLNRSLRSSRNNYQLNNLNENIIPLSKELPNYDLKGSIIGTRGENESPDLSPASNIEKELVESKNQKYDQEKFILQNSINPMETSKQSIEIKSSIIDNEIENKIDLSDSSHIYTDPENLSLKENQFNFGKENENVPKLIKLHRNSEVNKMNISYDNFCFDLIKPQLNEQTRRKSELNHINLDKVNEEKFNETVNSFLGKLNSSMHKKSIFDNRNQMENNNLNIEKEDLNIHKSEKIPIEEDKGKAIESQNIIRMKITNLSNQAKIKGGLPESDINVLEELGRMKYTKSNQGFKIEKEFFFLVIQLI